MRPIQVLLVGDNPADIDLTRETLEAGKLRHHVSVAMGGAQALSILRKGLRAPEESFTVPMLLSRGRP